MSNIGKFRLQCFDCEGFHYNATRVDACAKCERKRGRTHEKWLKRRARIVEKTDADYFKDAEEFADGMARLLNC